MKVNGVNKCYSVKIDKRFLLQDCIVITLSDVAGGMMSVAITKKNWEKLKEKV